jgi:hypothetical protein
MSGCARLGIAKALQRPLPDAALCAGAYCTLNTFGRLRSCRKPAVWNFGFTSKRLDDLVDGATRNHVVPKRTVVRSAAHRIQLAIRERTVIFERGGPRSVVALAHHLLHPSGVDFRPCAATLAQRSRRHCDPSHMSRLASW